ncbi:HAD-IIB family hydrolase [Mucilaginibacter aquariorum]|uniref:phosphomannomutase n=1 Tax=Mucilaginibacter aquariorum TaxID=2967225 RepID=A0ABT1SXQ1_9SPHI|nr:HAD-IIB family hydrolase [Mucilaginibacter aquariorum]MCQ6956998.1 HAD-IIB family hydrolase [Mucilaginibacter aquariorum]
MKKLVIFDLDGTLAESKAAIDEEMSLILGNLLTVSRVAIISGGDWPQFQKQVLAHLPDSDLKKLSILPTCGTKYYNYEHGWKKMYAENFTQEEKELIIKELTEAVIASGFEAEKTWGDQIEDRDSQITYSALGQSAPINEKMNWDPDFAKRKQIKKILDKNLKGFAVNMGGATSIDITKPGIDKAYGIKKLKTVLKIKISEMIFIGDALMEGGNDHPAYKTGVDCIKVRGPEDTKRVVEGIMVCQGFKPTQIK